MIHTMRFFITAMLLTAFALTDATAQKVSIRGTVKDATGRQGVEYASVTLMTSDSVFISGSTTETDGNFVFSSVERLKGYLIKVSCIGYATQITRIEGTTGDIDAGDILLTDDRVVLDGVTVTAQAQTGFSDRSLLYPTARQVKLANNGVNLLREMMIPMIEVNSFRNTISAVGGGEVQLRINDVEATIEDIMALLPSEVKRIEYLDNPGLRYGNAEVVLNYIVKRRTAGGNFSTDLMQAVNAGWGNGRMSGKINWGKSEFGVNVFSGWSDTESLVSSNTETFNMSNGYTLRRVETGEPSRFEKFNNSLNAHYSYAPDDKSYFNIRFRMMFNNMPHMDNRSRVYNADNPDDFVHRTGMYHSGRLKPTIDIYYQRALPNDQTIVFNIVGTYQKAKDNKTYIEETDNEILTSNNNRVMGRRRTLNGEVIYEKKLAKKQVLNFGIKHTHTFATNEHPDNGSKSSTQQGYTYAFGEYKKRKGKWDYAIGMGVTRSFHQNKGKDTETLYAVNPRLNVQYKISENSKIRLKGSARNASPGYDDLDETIQFVDSMQLKCGNGALESYMRYNTQLNYEWQKGLFYIGLRGTYDYEPNSIMEEKSLYGDKVMNTLDNQRNWQRMQGMATIKVGPIRDMLQISFTGGAARYLSKGNDYSHTLTNYFFNTSISANYKNFSAIWEMNNSMKSLRGETVSYTENFQMLGVTYRHKQWMFGTMVFFPFDNLKIKNEGLNRYASVKGYSKLDAAHKMLILKASYNISFGKQTKSKNRRFENEEEE